MNGPVGYDKHGYGYRSGGGERTHDAQREAYGSPYGEGDVVGMYVHLGGDAAAQARARRRCCTCAASAPAEDGGPHAQEVVQLDGQLFSVEQERAAGPARSSAVAFAVNGVSQGVAFTELNGGAPPPLSGPRRVRRDARASLAQTSSSPLQACSRSRRRRSRQPCCSTSARTFSFRRLR